MIKPKKTAVIRARVTAKFKKRLVAYCENEGIPEGIVVRLAAEEYLNAKAPITPEAQARAIPCSNVRKELSEGRHGASSATPSTGTGHISEASKRIALRVSRRIGRKRESSTRG